MLNGKVKLPLKLDIREVGIGTFHQTESIRKIAFGYE